MRDCGEFWTLPLTIDGETYRFWVDTGTGLLVFDSSLRHLLGDPVKQHVNTPVADRMIPLFAAPDARVGKLPIERRASVGCVDLAAVKSSARDVADGVLGCAFLRKYVVQFDFECAHFCFLASVSANPGEKLPFEGDEMRPHCRCTFEAGSDDAFMLDSGSMALFSVSLRDELFQSLTAEADANSVVAVPRLLVVGRERLADAFGQRHEIECGILRRFDFGRFALEQLRVSKGRSSTLGLRFLSRFVVTIDFPQRNIYLKPIEGADRDDFDGGVVIEGNRNGTFIRGVVPRGRALGLPLSPGDESIRLNGIETESTNLFALRRILGRSEQLATLEIKRADGTEATVRVPGRG